MFNLFQMAKLQATHRAASESMERELATTGKNFDHCVSKIQYSNHLISGHARHSNDPTFIRLGLGT